MRNVIIAPHNDDAIFSMGGFMENLPNLVVLSPFCGIPEDEKGKNKHLKLNKEHYKACRLIGATEINGDYMDDVYPTRNLSGLEYWFSKHLLDHDNIYVPLGIHHPDHVLIRDLFIKRFRIDYFYEELPYRVRYPYLADMLKMMLCSHRTLITCQSTELKYKSVKLYESQTNEGVIKDIMVEERIWQ